MCVRVCVCARERVTRTHHRTLSLSLTHTHTQGHTSSAAAVGADELLPILVFAVRKSGAADLDSSIHFMVCRLWAVWVGVVRWVSWLCGWYRCIGLGGGGCMRVTVWAGVAWTGCGCVTRWTDGWLWLCQGGHCARVREVTVRA